MAGPVTGQCLCGAVRVEVTRMSDDISACFCDMCRRWSGSVYMGIAVAPEDCKITGPLKLYQSSPFAERGWCGDCGTAVLFRNTDAASEPSFHLSPGLFDHAGGARLTRVVYADCAPAGVELAGDLTRVSRADYEARFDHVAEART